MIVLCFCQEFLGGIFVNFIPVYAKVYCSRYTSRLAIYRCVTQAKKHKACLLNTLRKHAYSNILKFLPPRNENFQMKNSDNFHISAQNIDCRYSLEPPRRGGSNEYHNLCF